MSNDQFVPHTPASVSSPIATGQDGAFFEQHVDAFFLALLLVRGIPPIFVDSQIEEVAFQTERLGRNTDDVLLRCKAGNQRQRRLYGQVKRSFTVSASDEDCVKTFTDFWQDFVDPQVFQRADDAFAIVTRHGTNVLLEQFSPLLDCARVATNSADFARRLNTPGLLSAKTIAYASTVRQILDAANGSPVTDDDLWQLLRHVYVVSLDLNSTTCQTEALIRTMLAQTAQGADPLGVAELTWLRLLQLVGRDGMPRAAGYTWDSLPEELRQSHSPVPTADHVALRTLRERTRTLRRGIRTVLGTGGGGFHVHRDQLVADIRQSLCARRVVIVTGPSGVGKSAVASEAFDHLKANHFAFAFRAEEFAAPHLDTTLHNASIQITAERLAGVLAGQAQKVLLIESVERLLEKETRDAFKDLLALVRDDPSWQLILTCRDYSLDVVRSSFLDYVGIPCGVIEIPPLSEPELDSVIATLPHLARPASNRQLRQLFRNPYVLDKAATMDWPAEGPLPADERAFRRKFMREVVRAEQDAGEGMPQRRAETFAQVALRRARALDAYAPCDDLDAASLESLFQRNLIVYSEESRALAAPAHDVLEDWAILQWIEDRSQVHGASFAAFIEELGTHPAVRRAYRKWLSELLVSDAARADAFANAVMQNQNLPRYFSDDTLVAVLRSPGAAQFLERHERLLLANDAQMLRRVIHLIRVACKTTPTWLPVGARLPPMFFVPQGAAWSAVLQLIRVNLDDLLPRYSPLIVGLLDDWTGTIHANETLPAGSSDACAIAHALLAHLSGYRSDRSRERIVRLLAMIPLADEAGFRRLLADSASGTATRPLADTVKDTLLTSMHSLAACRDVPDAVIHLAEQTFYVTDDDLRNPHFGTHDLELEPIFGLKNCGTRDFSPASAFQGPFLFLLQNHPDLALPFLIRFLNRAVDWYAHQRHRRRRPLEQPWEAELTLRNQTRVQQWCNGRLWPLYRGLSAGPYVLQCALMALEHWLLHLCETRPADVEGILLRILRDSQNAAASAVVASAATAHPQIAGAAAVALLTSPDFVRLDKARSVTDTGSAGRRFLPSRPDQRIFDQEREQSDALPHRRMDLECTALRLQTTAWRQTVQDLLDAYHNQLPPPDQQTNQDRLWRIALQRMDLRQYTAHPTPREAPPVANDAQTDGEPAENRTRILLQPTPFPADIQAMIDQDAPEQTAQHISMSLFMWGVSVFQDKNSSSAGDWRVQLAAAQIASGIDESTAEVGGIHFRVRGIEFVAAVSVRDHWDDLTPGERTWCFDTLCDSVTIGADSSDELQSVQRGGVDSGRAAAIVLPLLMTKQISVEQRLRAIRGIAVALTHAVDEVVDYAVQGVRQYLWSVDPDLCRTCIGALARSARELDAQLSAQRARTWTERDSSRDLERAIAEQVRSEIIQRRPALDEEVRLNSPEWHARHTNLRIVTLLADQGQEPLAEIAYSAAVEQLVNQWPDDDDGDRRDYAWEGACAQQIARFVVSLRLPDALALVAPLLQRLEEHRDEIASFVEDLVVAEDALARPDTFWALWQAFADQALQTTWPNRLEDYGEYDQLLRHLFLGLPWSQDVRHWKSLDGHAQRITRLFCALPRCAAVLDSYVRFLLSVGMKSLPWAFIVISRQMSQGNANEMLALANTVTGLEILLRRYVYAVPAFLKSDPDLRQAVLHLLDELVEAGSSAAYRMRDDFVTPSPPASTA